MGYFSEMDLMRGAPCLLDEIAKLRREDTMRGYDDWATQSDEHLLADDDEDDTPGRCCTRCLSPSIVVESRRLVIRGRRLTVLRCRFCGKVDSRWE